ncbi:hypothetical protein OAS39_13800, partial [Pirellulales bacterium]|nr:hypothetical protein [Pirellulales bacterium]
MFDADREGVAADGCPVDCLALAESGPAPDKPTYSATALTIVLSTFQNVDRRRAGTPARSSLRGCCSNFIDGGAANGPGGLSLFPDPARGEGENISGSG